MADSVLLNLITCNYFCYQQKPKIFNFNWQLFNYFMTIFKIFTAQNHFKNGFLITELFDGSWSMWYNVTWCTMSTGWSFFIKIPENWRFCRDVGVGQTSMTQAIQSNDCFGFRGSHSKLSVQNESKHPKSEINFSNSSIILFRRT